MARGMQPLRCACNSAFGKDWRNDFCFVVSDASAAAQGPAMWAIFKAILQARTLGVI